MKIHSSIARALALALLSNGALLAIATESRAQESSADISGQKTQTAETLSDALGPAADSDLDSSGIGFAYPAKEGTIRANVSYAFEVKDERDLDSSGRILDEKNSDHHRFHLLLGYDVLDSLAVGVDEDWRMTLSQTTVPDQPGPKTNDNYLWSDPSFFATWKAFDQGQIPATLYLRAGYTPDFIAQTESVVDIGETAVRDEKTFAVAETFDAIHRSSVQTGKSVSQSVWSYKARILAALPLSQKWSAYADISYGPAYDRTDTPLDFSKLATIDGYSSELSMGVHLKYDLTPGDLKLVLGYSHRFETAKTSTPLSAPSQFTVRQTDGLNIISIALSSTTPFDDIRSAIL